MKEKTEEKKTKDTGNSKNDNKYLYFLSLIIFCSKTIYKNLVYAITFVLAFLTLQVISM